jgi:DNA-binding transcriptional LysR family regulator
MALNLHLLRFFHAVAEHQGFSKAAERLYVSQPAVSKGIQELEQQVGLALFDRSRRSLTLTAAGELLYQYTQSLYAIEKAAETALEQLHGLERGHLALGASYTVGTYRLPALLSKFHQQYPGITLSLEIANTGQILDQLRTGSFDLTYVEGPVRGTDVIVSEWSTDRLVVIAPPGHPLIASQPVELEDLASVPYVQREAGSGTREIVEVIFGEQGLSLNVAVEMGSNQVIKQAVSAGLGISMVSDVTIALERLSGTLVVLEVANYDSRRVLSEVRVKGRPLSPAASAFKLLSKAKDTT